MALALGVGWPLEHFDDTLSCGTEALVLNFTSRYVFGWWV